MTASERRGSVLNLKPYTMIDLKHDHSQTNSQTLSLPALPRFPTPEHQFQRPQPFSEEAHNLTVSKRRGSVPNKLRARGPVWHLNRG